MKREETIVKETIDGLLGALWLCEQNGECKIGVDPGVVDDAIDLLEHYGAMLEAIKSAKRRLR